MPAGEPLPSDRLTVRPPDRPTVRPSDYSMLLVCAIWGVNFSMLKFILQTMPPFALTAVRYLIATAVLWAVVRWLEPDVRVPRHLAWRLLALGVVGNTLYQAGFATGLTYTTASNSALLIASTPLMTAAVGAALGYERITAPIAAAILIGTAGMVLIILGDHGLDLSAGTLKGDGLTLLAVLCWAFFTHGVRRSVAPEVTPLQSTLLTTVGGTPGLVLLGFPDLLRQDWGAVGLSTWAALLYASLLSIVLCYLLWTRSVRTIGPNRTALWGLTTPVFALSSAALMLGERVKPLQIVGALFILGSVAVNILAHWWQEPAAAPAEEGV